MSEVQLQIAIAEFLKWNEDPASWTYFHCPNGEIRDKRTAAKLKAMGVRPGVPDIILEHRGQVIYVEVKTPKGYMTARQLSWRERAEIRGAPFHIVRSIDDMAEVLQEHGIPIKVRVAA